MALAAGGRMWKGRGGDGEATAWGGQGEDEHLKDCSVRPLSCLGGPGPADRVGRVQEHGP